MKKSEKISISAVACGGFRPWRTPVENDGGGECNVEGRRTRLCVVVVVDGEGAEEVARRRK